MCLKRSALGAHHENVRDDKISLRDTLAMERKTGLYARIKLWKNVQHLYMPGTDNLEGFADDGDGTNIGDGSELKLNFPSSFKREVRERITTKAIYDKERALRKAVGYDSLHELRQLMIRAFVLVNWKLQHISGPGQKLNTRANSTISELYEKRSIFVKRYRRARAALVELDPNGDWKEDLLELRDEDIKVPVRAARGNGEGRRTQSWIWKTRDAALSSNDATRHLNEAIEKADISLIVSEGGNEVLDDESVAAKEDDEAPIVNEGKSLFYSLGSIT